jgi:saccharopine dehydrogenase-like NADP-dependent oxidoreductase
MVLKGIFIFAAWLAKGKITKRGVLPPEECIDSESFFCDPRWREMLVEKERLVSLKFH